MQDLLGTWIYSAEIRGKDGQKSEEKLILHFDESGQYYIVYQFQQASGARTTKTQAGIFGCRTGFCLEYENGKDILRIDGLNPSELWLTYFPDPVHRATSLSCKRATSQPAQATLPRESSRFSILM